MTLQLQGITLHGKAGAELAIAAKIDKRKTHARRELTRQA